MAKLPDYYAKCIFDVPMDFFKNAGFRVILADLDNTLDSYDTLTPSSRVNDFYLKVKDAGLELVIVSNNRGKRVGNYATALGVKYLSSTRKPFGFKLKKFIEENGFNKAECILCGDQLITDIPCGRRAGIKTLLLDPISKKDQWTTRFNRLIDRPKRKRLIKKKLIKHLEFTNVEEK